MDEIESVLMPAWYCTSTLLGLALFIIFDYQRTWPAKACNLSFRSFTATGRLVVLTIGHLGYLVISCTA